MSVVHTSMVHDAHMIALAYDLGGTKIAAGAVNERGKVLFELREPARFSDGKLAVLAQMTRMGREILSRYPKIKVGAIASAGPLDPVKGDLLDPTNFVRNGKRWGRTPIARELSKRLRIRMKLENDAAAAILAEHWVGGASGYANAMVLTLGTGLGTAAIANGKLVRSGRMIHPEAGHVVIRAGDRTALCGCGVYGCSEAFLSGNGFTRRAHRTLRDPSLTTHEIVARAKGADKAAKRLFFEYGELMAVAIHNYCVLYSPEIILFAGGFAEATPLFLKRTQTELKKLLRHKRTGIDLLPKLKKSPLHNQSGLIGAGFIALHPNAAVLALDTKIR